jgi:hypothetical protein
MAEATLLSHEELLAHATARCSRGGSGVGAAYDRDLTERDRDEARRWRFLVVDETGRFAYVEFLATRIPYSASFLTEPLEEAVEHFVSRSYPAEPRLAALVAVSQEPIVLPLTERYREPVGL